MRQNDFKTAIAARKRQLGLWLALAEPYAAEICATAGFDWLLIDAEHGPNDIRLVLSQLQALEGRGCSAIVRLLDHNPATIKQVLDIGALTLLVPMVQTAAQAQALVSAVNYPPNGMRGVASSMTRASLWNADPGYILRAREEICLVAQVECRIGVENITSIAGTNGIDAVFIGPADLAASLGHLGQPSHPEVQAVIGHCADVLSRSGKPGGIFATTPDDFTRYRKMGFSFISVGTDVGLLANGARMLAREYAPNSPSSSG